MSTLVAPATRRYIINDQWLKAFRGLDNTANQYIDVEDVINQTGPYVTWCAANVRGWNSAAESAAMNFMHTGIHVDETGEIEGVFLDEESSRRGVMEYGARITHPHRYKRIYPRRTTARGLTIVGLTGSMRG